MFKKSVSTSYFTLKDPVSIPHSNTVILEPFDNTLFRPTPKDTLETLLSQIKKHRLDNNYQYIDDDQLKNYIIKCLYETSTSRQKANYFKPTSSTPTISQAAQFLKAFYTEVTTSDTVSTKQAKDRATYCLKCPHHKKSATPPAFLDTIAPNSLESNLVFDELKELGVCGICGCGMQNKIKLSTNATIASLSPQNFETLFRFSNTKAFTTCWIFSEAVSKTHLTRLLSAKLRNISPKYEVMFNNYLNSLKPQEGK